MRVSNLFAMFALSSLILTATAFAAPGAKDAPAATDDSSHKSNKSRNHNGRIPIGVGIKASTLGLGVEAAVPLSRFANIRGGFNGFQYSRMFADNGIQYNGNLRFRSVETLVDIFPFGGAFHISPGMLAYNGNQVTANALVPGGQSFSLGDANFISNPINPVNGTGVLVLNKVAPMVRWGFGNMVPRNKRFSFHLEGGAVFQGPPKTTLSLSGSACDPLVSLICHNVATDPTIQSQVQAEQNKINKDLTILKYYPAFSMGVSYKF